MFFFFFKHKTAYEMRISDWSSDVCSSDLRHAVRTDIPMHSQIRDHAAFDKLGLCEVAGQLDALPCVISRGMANSTSRASCASLRFSVASTAFHSFSRSAKSFGASSGRRISEWTTPDSLVKSW